MSERENYGEIAMIDVLFSKSKIRKIKGKM